MRVTLIKDVDRVEIDDEILQNHTGASYYRFDVAMRSPQIRFEEVGAIARRASRRRAATSSPGTRADHMTLNHFVGFADGGYAITLSSWDAMAMRSANSTATAFDLPTSEVSVLATGNPSDSGITDQGGDTSFRNRFALPARRPWSGPDAMRASLAHQTPLVAVPLPANHAGPLSAATRACSP